jgi:superfamily I DNA/RNA helicase
VEDTELYVADGIVTHNSIYGFTGADADAVDLIIEDFNCIQLPLTVTYRCSKAATKFAQTWVPHIEAHGANTEGNVYEVSADTFMNQWVRANSGQIRTTDAILCRMNRPLVSLAFALLREGIPCHVEGRDIGSSLEKLVTKWKSVKTVEDLVARVDEYRSAEIAKFQARGSGGGGQLQALNDKIDTLLVISEGCSTLLEIRQKIDRLFKDTDGNHRSTVTLSSVHKAKGREWDRVMILGFGHYMPSPYARQEWEIQQERNLMYVAATRTKEDLVLLPSLDDYLK